MLPYLSIVLISCLTALSLASPVVRQSVCTWDVTGKFTMTAVSYDTNKFIKPLALGKNGFDGYFSIATEESIDQGDLFTETFNLFDGSMNAYDGEGNLVAVSAKVDQDNGMLTFRAFGPNVLAVETYTELCAGNDLYFLQAYGTQEFSLCKSTTSDEVIAVFMPGPDGVWFDYTTCTRVTIQLNGPGAARSG